MLCLYRAGYDFKRLFTISEYYDRDRIAFYRAIQSVRESRMDMTGWLEYFIEGLSTQLAEVKQRGKQMIRRDVLVQKHGLNNRQSRAVDYIMQNDKLTIQGYEALCPEVNRRTLQRDLKAMIDMELLVSEGSTNQLIYRMKE
jgi:Fic family protein